eukprot:scaffold10219_cov275-Chaetoceros_neogracile.AAC.3
MDVIGLGDEGTELPARIHYVIDEGDGKDLDAHDARPIAIMPKDWVTIQSRIQVSLPHDSTQEVVFHIVAHYVQKTKDYHTFEKGSNAIDPVDIPHHYLFDADTSKDNDVTIIIGYDSKESSIGSLLLFRFHKLDPTFDGDETARTLLKKLSINLNNDGFERRRSGGSSGFLSYNANLFEMMSTPNFAPRCAKGCVILPDQNRLAIHVYYIGTQDGVLKYVQYTTPQHGGSFVMPPGLIEEQTLLQDFFMVKPLSAMILLAMKDQHPRKLQVTPKAVENELLLAEEAHRHVASIEAVDKLRCKIEYYQYISNKVKCTLVQHPVGRHLDIFANHEPALENRICFHCELSDKEKLATGSSRYGRGGFGTNYHSYAILDWPKK